MALYLASDVMLVTALRDGMNLVAKEYVASRFDNDGVLVLSEFAGAADELKSALLVNPHDIDGLKESIMEAIEMKKSERSRRMRALRKRVRDYDVVALVDRVPVGPDRPERNALVRRDQVGSIRPMSTASNGTSRPVHPAPAVDETDDLIERLRELARTRAPARRARLRRHPRARGRRAEPCPRASRGAARRLRAADAPPTPGSRSSRVERWRASNR